VRFVARLIALACFGLAALGTANAERRLALAVGIDVYDNLKPLQKAVNDARAVGAALTELGFDTAIEENLARLPFSRAWQKFLNRLQPGDTAAVFFAGHGVEIGGVNYLLPRDVPKVGQHEEQVLADASIRFNTLMDNLRARKVRVSLFILDACRENPTRDDANRSGVGGTRGLERVDPPEGTFVMYSAGVGESALDRLPGSDSSLNSVFTRALLPVLKTPGLSLPEIARRVRAEVVDVARGAGHRQTPAYYDQVVGDLLLKAGAAEAFKPAAVGAASEAMETARVCREVEGMSSLAMLTVLERQHRGRPAGECVTARVEEVMKRQTALVASPKPIEPAAVFNPTRAPAPLTDSEERALKPKDSFKECLACSEMVVVPAGNFIMGSSAAEIAALNKEAGWNYTSNEGPQHTVTITRPFAAGKFEVTFAEWDACVAAGGCKHNPDDSGWGRGKRPVIGVSWNDITGEYLPWLSRTTGKTYRLLTEAEWEYAARAGTTTRYAFGDTITKRQAQFSEGSSGSARKTVAVGSFLPNAFGLHDMHGNVWELVQDCSHGSYNGAPTDGSAWTTGECGGRMHRGADWFMPPRELRSARRASIHPATRSPYMGFRLARTLESIDSGAIGIGRNIFIMDGL
jgi:formylglycine-generating enzyme required for sulfatase activity